MKLGWCTAVDNIDKAAEYGYDYIEIGVTGVAAMSDEEFSAALEKAKAAKIPVAAANVIFPGAIHLTGEIANHEEIAPYLEKAFSRLEKLGVKTVVFGSGGSKRVPEGFPHDKAFLQLADASQIISDKADKYGITIALEPLNRGETNIINSVSEGGELVELVNRSSFMLLADYYHIGKENEGFDGISTYGKYIRHIHIAHPITRTVPADKDGGNYEAFIDALKKIQYEGGISIEAGVKEPDKELPAAAVYLKGLIK